MHWKNHQHPASVDQALLVRTLLISQLVNNHHCLLIPLKAQRPLQVDPL